MSWTDPYYSRHHQHLADLGTKLVCNDCGTVVRSFYSFERHRKAHSGVKGHTCPWPGCGKAFHQKNNMTVHYRTHTKERPFQCPYCSRCFGSSATLNRHKGRYHEIQFSDSIPVVGLFPAWSSPCASSPGGSSNTDSQSSSNFDDDWSLDDN